MTQDPYKNSTDSLIAPAANCFAITPDDNSELSIATKALYVGTGGDIVLRTLDAQSDVTLRNVISGSILDLRVRAVRSTGTSAQDIVGLA